MDKAKISNIALKVVKEVIKDKKYKNLTDGIINNTNEDMTEEQVKRVLEEVNKKVFTMIYNERDDKDFSFDIAVLEEVLSSKNYRKTEKKTNILEKKSHKIASELKNVNLEEVFKAAAYILGDSNSGDGFGIKPYNIACEVVFDCAMNNDFTKSVLIP